MQATRQQLVAETDQTYWQTVALGDQVRLAEGNRTQLLKPWCATWITSARPAPGYKADLLRAEVQLRAADVRLLRTRDDQRQSQLVLRQLIGRPAADSLRLAESIAGAVSGRPRRRLRGASPGPAARFAPSDA